MIRFTPWWLVIVPGVLAIFGGAAVSGEVPLPAAKLPTPLSIVLGSEGTGIRPGLQKHLDFTFTLPMPGAQLSFNVATAAALIAYELNCRRA